MSILIYIAYTFYFIAALMMIGAILLQEGKGGGLSALGGTQAESAFGASNPIRRMTVFLAVVFFLLAGFLSIMSPKSAVRFKKGAGPASTGSAEPRKDADEAAKDASAGAAGAAEESQDSTEPGGGDEPVEATPSDGAAGPPAGTSDSPPARERGDDGAEEQDDGN